MSLYEKRRKDTAVIMSEILGEPVRATHNFTSKRYLSIWQMDFIDHTNEIFSKTGRSLGLVIQPYRKINEADEKRLNENGFQSLDLPVEGWWNKGTYPYLIIKMGVAK